MTWADIAMADFLDRWLPVNDIGDMARFTLLTDLMNNVCATDPIKAYLASRKKTDF